MYNSGMKIEDARTLSPSAQEEKRKLAIKLWKKGELIKAIAEIVGVSFQAVSGWVNRYQREGPSSLKSKKRGPKNGNRSLSPDQERQIQKLIVDKSPDQLKLDYVLWTRKAVMKLIQHETGIKMPIRTAGEYLKRWGVYSAKACETCI